MRLDLDLHLPGIVAGDASAFARWLAGAEPIVRDTLRPLAAAVDAEAVLQEALLRVWQVAPRVEPDGSPNALLRFAIRVARNLAISELRRTRAAATDPGDLEAVLAAAARPVAAPDPLLRNAIAHCRDKLPGKPREALDARLADAGARDDDELAATLGMRLNTFLQNITRARRLLADCLRRRGIAIDEELAS